MAEVFHYVIAAISFNQLEKMLLLRGRWIWPAFLDGSDADCRSLFRGHLDYVWAIDISYQGPPSVNLHEGQLSIDIVELRVVFLCINNHAVPLDILVVEGIMW